MAITNAQQYKQLVNPPMEGKKRPGYRGEAAAASDITLIIFTYLRERAF